MTLTHQARKAGRKLCNQLEEMQMQHLILSIGLVLQFYRSQRELSMGLLIIWLTINWIIPLKDSLHSKRLDYRACAYAIALSLLLIQTRTIVENQDELGISQFLIIISGAATTISLNREKAKRLLQWISVPTILGSIILLAPLLMHYEFSESGVNIMNREVLGEGFGDINQLRIVITFFTIVSLVSARLSSSIPARSFTLSGAFLGYIIIVAMESRMGQIAIPLGAIGGWLFGHWPIIRTNKIIKAKFVLISLAAGLVSFVWKIVVTSDLSSGMASDRGRLAIVQCWAKSILSGSNRFLMGFGHDNTEIRKLCTDHNIGYFHASDTISSSGHAHNTFINILAHYGILGVIAVGILFVLIGRAIIINLRQDNYSLRHKSPFSASWTECTTSIVITILICALSNTIYTYNHAIQLLLGLLIALPLCEGKLNSNFKTQQHY